MTAFVAAAAALLMLAMGVVAFGPRLQRRVNDVSRAAANAEVLRQQLADLERERALGALDEAGFAQARDELQRRLMGEVGPIDAPVPAVRGSPRAVLLAVAAALPLAAGGLYVHFGQPQSINAPVVAAFGTGAAGVDGLLPQLEAHVGAAPSDARTWVLLARARMQRDQFGPAAVAYASALAASAKVARDPLIWCEYADALGMAAGGRLAGRPREMIDKALALDAQHPRALEMAGSAAFEAGDFRGAVRYWQQLLAQLPADSTEYQQLAAALTRVERRVQFSLPPS